MDKFIVYYQIMSVLSPLYPSRLLQIFTKTKSMTNFEENYQLSRLVHTLSNSIAK